MFLKIGNLSGQVCPDPGGRRNGMGNLIGQPAVMPDVVAKVSLAVEWHYWRHGHRQPAHHRVRVLFGQN
jgi:hypothetical protein